jgi:adenylate kinase family enzyme
MTNAPMAERMLVIGTSCTGKSTFARSLAAKTKLPLVELDAL